MQLENERLNNEQLQSEIDRLRREYDREFREKERRHQTREKVISHVWTTNPINFLEFGTISER